MLLGVHSVRRVAHLDGVGEVRMDRAAVVPHLELPHPRQPEHAVLVHDVAVGGRHAARLLGHDAVRAEDLRPLVALVVPRLPVEAVEQVVLGELPEEPHVGHVELPRKQAAQHVRVPEVRGRVPSESHLKRTPLLRLLPTTISCCLTREDRAEEDDVNDELSQCGLDVQLLVALVRHHLP